MLSRKRGFFSDLFDKSTGYMDELQQFIEDSKRNPEAIHAVDQAGDPPLLWAAICGRVDAVNALLAAGANVNATSSGGSSVLICASANGRTDIVRILLAAKADIHATNNFGCPALVVALQHDRNDVIALLLAAGASANTTYQAGRLTLLGLAAISGNTEVVTALLAAKANVNAANYCGRTAIMEAADSGHVDTVKILLKVPGINLDARNVVGTTAADLAMRHINDGPAYKEIYDLITAAPRVSCVSVAASAAASSSTTAASGENSLKDKAGPVDCIAKLRSYMRIFKPSHPTQPLAEQAAKTDYRPS